MGAYDGTKICELVNCLVLHNLDNIIDSCNHGLYRDDQLSIVDNCTLRKDDVIRKIAFVI